MASSHGIQRAPSVAAADRIGPDSTAGRGRGSTPAELTLDHVIPKSRGGNSNWDNLVACCKRCNNRKGSRTPEEAGMKLARLPRPFSLHTSRHLMRLLGKSDDQWRKYLFY